MAVDRAIHEFFLANGYRHHHENGFIQYDEQLVPQPEMDFYISEDDVVIARQGSVDAWSGRELRWLKEDLKEKLDHMLKLRERRMWRLKELDWYEERRELAIGHCRRVLAALDEKRTLANKSVPLKRGWTTNLAPTKGKV